MNEYRLNIGNKVADLLKLYGVILFCMMIMSSLDENGLWINIMYYIRIAVIVIGHFLFFRSVYRDRQDFFILEVTGVLKYFEKSELKYSFDLRYTKFDCKVQKRYGAYTKYTLNTKDIISGEEHKIECTHLNVTKLFKKLEETNMDNSENVYF